MEEVTYLKHVNFTKDLSTFRPKIGLFYEGITRSVIWSTILEELRL